MPTRLEESLERDIERIRQHVLEMSSLAERALRDTVEALVENKQQIAYAVILRDQYIDEKEKEIDRLCLEFLVRQQPVGGLLRLAYSTIKINLELERVGDYAESVARHVLKLSTLPRPPAGVVQRLVQMADLAIPMLHDSIDAFIRQDPEQARKTILAEPSVDALLGKLNSEVVELLRQQQIVPEMMEPLVTIGRRFERVADQARNICMEVLYMCTGEYAKHPGVEAFRVLFVGEHNSCRSQMAEAIAQALNQPKFIFSSAGLDPRPIDAATLQFMKEKGHDLSRMFAKTIYQVPNLDYYQVVVGVAEQAQGAFPRSPRNTVYVDWSIDDPSGVKGSPEEIRAAYERTYTFLSSHVRALVEAVLGNKVD
jgi:phosphate transport system protein